MAIDKSSPPASNQPAPSLTDLPPDVLRRHAADLGLEADLQADRDALVALIRRRQELLVELDRDALLEVVVWGRRPVRRSATKEQLARQIGHIQRTNYDSLSTRGLYALARLRGLDVRAADSAAELMHRLRKADGLLGRVKRKGRSMLSGWLMHMIEGKATDEAEEYHFLPEDDGPEAQRRSLKADVEERGIVGGIAQRLRGAADDYLRVKMDEIEARIDAKLDEIDKRLSEWRDREVANRLRILRITLIFTVLVAVLSLGYNAIKYRLAEKPPTATQVVRP